MLRKIYTLFVTVAMLSTLVFAQNRAILTPDNQLIPASGSVYDAVQNSKLIPHGDMEIKNVIVSGNEVTSTKGTIDTLSIFDELGIARNSYFYYTGQDVMIQWYVAPADMYLKAIAFTLGTAEALDEGASIKVSIVGTDLTADEVAGLLVDGNPTFLGYYPSDNYVGGRAPFSWFGNGDWTAGTEGIPEIWKYDLWSDFGDGYPVTSAEVSDPDNGSIIYNWVVLSDALGYEPEMIHRGEVFGIVLQHGGLSTSDARIGYLYNSAPQHPGFKYYSTGRLTDDGSDAGWWSRAYTWDYVAEVDLVGDRPPVITDVTSLLTTLSTDAREVTANITDDNPSGGAYGVASASLCYSTDDMATWNEVAMTANGDVYSASIPGQAPGTHVYYKVKAIDVEGNEAENGPYDYYVFAPYNKSLVLYNGYPATDDFLMAYYFYGDTSGYINSMDLWCYGVADAELFGYYQNVYELTSKGPIAIYNDVVSAWLGNDAGNNYALFGDEWLGAQSGWTNGPHEAGEFHYDVLGITYEYNDVNYAASGDQYAPYNVYAVEGSLLGGEVAASVAANGDTAYYDPYNIYGVANWLDAVDFETDVEVDYTTIPAGMTEQKPIAGHRTLTAGNKIVFMAFDPLYLASDSVWYGITAISPLIKTCDWFGVPVGVEDEVVPTKFELSQNYPNPFNPTTVIKYTLPQEANVTLKVYNLVGQEVATLVNSHQVANTYQVTFDASRLSSGVYFYTLKAGNFTVTKKMMLLK